MQVHLRVDEYVSDAERYGNDKRKISDLRLERLSKRPVVMVKVPIDSTEPDRRRHICIYIDESKLIERGETHKTLEGKLAGKGEKRDDGRYDIEIDTGYGQEMVRGVLPSAVKELPDQSDVE